MDFSIMHSDFIVVLPAHNEEKNIKKVITQVLRHFNKNQILLADDGSTDNTSTIAREMGISIIRSPTNRGKGYILHRTFEAILQYFPNTQWVMTFDADGQHNHHDIAKFLEILQDNPKLGILVGKRDCTRMPIKNWVSNALTSGWCKYWLNWDISDLQCGFRCYRTKSLRKILSYGLTKNKFDLETEILIVAWLLDIKMTETAISTLYIRNNRKSKVIPTIDTFRWVILILQKGFSLEFIRKMWYRRYMRKMK